MDSDIDMVLAERVRATGIGVGTQRALLQRQFVEQIQSAFQLIKVCSGQYCCSWSVCVD